jgi:dihydrolipoamide dehydrogenase
MPESRYDCIVIGSGPGGYVGAIRAAQLGMKTAVVEKEFIGGRCLNIACIPAKAVLRAADVATEVRHAGDFGVKVGEPEIDFSGVGAHRDKVVQTLTGGVSMLLKKNKVDVIEGPDAERQHRLRGRRDRGRQRDPRDRVDPQPDPGPRVRGQSA